MRDRDVRSFPTIEREETIKNAPNFNFFHHPKLCLVSCEPDNLRSFKRYAAVLGLSTTLLLLLCLVCRKIHVEFLCVRCQSSLPLGPRLERGWRAHCRRRWQHKNLNLSQPPLIPCVYMRVVRRWYVLYRV